MWFAALAALALAGGRAQAQSDEDLLVPLTPSPAKKKAAPKKKSVKPGKAAPSESDLVVPLVAPAVANGELDVQVDPTIKGATLFVDRKSVGELPLPPQSLPAGDHTVLVRRVGFKDFLQQVSVSPGQTLKLQAELEPESAVLAVTANSPDAQVWVDGRPVGGVPLSEHLLNPGTHDVTVKADGYEEQTWRLPMKAGKNITVQATLRALRRPSVAQADPRFSPLPPEPKAASGPAWYQRWYVWAGAGLLVAGGTTVAITTANAQFSEEQVCGGACVGRIR